MKEIKLYSQIQQLKSQGFKKEPVALRLNFGNRPLELGLTWGTGRWRAQYRYIMRLYDALICKKSH